MRTFNLIALILSIIFTGWFLIFVTSNGRISTAEFLPVGLLFGVFSIAHSLVAVFHQRKERNNDHIV